MKRPLTTFILAIVTIMLVGTILTSCKQKGCTDINALNYDSGAGEDDGSCIYCKTTAQLGDSTQLILSDSNYVGGNNPFFGDQIVQMTLATAYMSYNSSKCGSNFCNVSAKIHNLVNKRVLFACKFYTTYNYYDSVYSNLSVPPLGTITISSVFTDPSNSPCTLPAITVVPQSTFTYQ